MAARAHSRFPLTTDRIRAIANNTFREAVRNRAFIGLMMLALFFLVFSIALSQLAVPGQAARVLLNFGFFSISLFGVLIAIVMGVILVHKEIEKKTIYTIVPKPVHRFEVILGKYVGMLLILLVEVGVLAAVWMLILWAEGVPPSAQIVKALLLVFMEVMLVTAVAVVFSSFSTPVLSGIFTTGIFVLGRVAASLQALAAKPLKVTGAGGAESDVAERIGELSGSVTSGLLDVVAAIVPDLTVFDGSDQVLLGVDITNGYLLGAFGYALSYIVVLLALAVLLFQRRDFL